MTVDVKTSHDLEVDRYHYSYPYQAQMLPQFTALFTAYVTLDAMDTTTNCIGVVDIYEDGGSPDAKDPYVKVTDGIDGSVWRTTFDHPIVHNVTLEMVRDAFVIIGVDADKVTIIR